MARGESKAGLGAGASRGSDVYRGRLGTSCRDSIQEERPEGREESSGGALPGNSGWTLSNDIMKRVPSNSVSHCKDCSSFG